MKLKSFRVKKFRNIVDCGEICVDPSVTCLVGKNEAGKSGLLEALHLFNPAYGSEFEVQEQYPRWLMAQDRKRGALEDHSPISVTFCLDDGDLAAIADILGPDIWTPSDITLGRRYNGDLEWPGIDFPEHASVKALIGRFPPAVASYLSDVASLDEVRTKLTDPKATDDGKQPSTEDIEAATSTMRKLGVASRSFIDACSEVLEERLPVFFRFTAYSTLPGRINFSDIPDAQEDGLPRDDVQTARALLKLAGADIEQIANDDYEVRKAELEAVQVDLTNQVFEYWQQNRDLEVSLDVDRTPDGQRFLDVRLRDRRTGYSNNFSQRSSGFQWFFSFLAAFSEFETGEPPIILLDEPALNLHGRAQGDFLRFINERLARSSPVLYTTHSPFMVKPDQLKQVRVIEDRGPPEGATSSTELVASDPDSLFPLQAALGYDIAQNLFVGPHNLVVEGISDYIYLTVMSAVCAASGQQGLDERWRILPAGGATNIPTFVSLVGPHLDVTVLVDSDTRSIQRIKGMAGSGLMAGHRIVFVDAVTPSSHAEIEDLFEEADYLDLYNKTFENSIEASGLPKGDRITKRISACAEQFDHGRVAHTLLSRTQETQFSEKTLDRFSKLIQLINQTIGT